MRKFPLSVLSASVLFSTLTYAQTQEPTVELETMVINVSQEAGKYVAIKPISLKDDSPLYETAQSITVLTPQQVEQKQASTVAELLENVAGVNSGVQGRRGWDDFIIRGQVSSAQTYVDGMRVQTSTNNLRAWDVGAADAIEVVKGPATADYGMGLPGGIVNITSKRPQNESFNRATITLGNFNQKEISYDINHAPNETNKGAFRLNGRYSDRDDATDYVFFKNFYIAPSYTFDLGDKTNLTVLGSYQWREYLRQQGLPHNNKVNLRTGVKTVRNAHEKYPDKTFFGLPQNTDEQKTFRVGYDLSHNLNDKVKLSSIFAVTKTETDGNPTLARSFDNFYRDGIIGREVNVQDKKDTMYTMDNRAQMWFDTGRIQHDVTTGVDLLRERSHYIITRGNANESFDADTPDYTYTGTGVVRKNRDWLTHTQYAGVYLKDKMRFNDFIVNLAARHDWANTQLKDDVKKTYVKSSDNAFTGTASIMYDYQGKFAPYISYGTSFNPNNDLGQDGKILDAEKGHQAEVGVKFQGFSRRLQGYLSYYDLTRKNVAETVEGANYSDLIGKQRTKGVELETALVLNNQWNISGTYSYIPTAKIEEAATSYEKGQRISQIPKHAASLSTQYHFSPDRLGWYVGGGARYQGKRTAWRSTSFIDLPSYALLDLKAGYEAKHWGVGLAVKNVFDKDYLIGTTPNSQLVSYGEPRNIRVSVKFKY